MRLILRLVLALAHIGIIALLPSLTRAEVATHMVLSEIQTGTAVSASQEFIELYNPTDTDVSLSGWTLEYKSATGPDSSWSKRATLVGLIKSHGFFLIAPKNYLAQSDVDMSPTLASSGGNIRLKDFSGSIVDQLGYGETANAAEGSPALAPPSGQSLERLPGRLLELGGNGTDGNVNAADFILRLDPRPQNTQSLIEVNATGGNVPVGEVYLPELSAPSSQGNPAEAPPNATYYAPLDITEVLPNPISPLTDARDEFIELYNPTDRSVDLRGYV